MFKKLIGFERNLLKTHPIGASIFLLALLAACGFAAWGRFQPLPARDWNTTQIKRLPKTAGNGVDFAIVGDSKNDSGTLGAILANIAHDPNIQFIITLGDLVATGDKTHYADVLEQLRRSAHVPVFLCTGNHELTHGGTRNYPRIAGPLYYSFHVGNSAIFVLDDATPGRLDQHQLDWLSKTLADYQKLDNRIVVMHVPPFDPRSPGDGHAMDKKKADALMSILKEGHVTQIFASHIHGYFHGQWQGIPYWISGGAGARLAGDDPKHYFFHFLKVKTQGPRVDVQLIRLDVGSGIGWGRIPYEAKRSLRNWVYFRHVSLALIVALIALLTIHVSAQRAWNSSRRRAKEA